MKTTEKSDQWSWSIVVVDVAVAGSKKKKKNDGEKMRNQPASQKRKQTAERAGVILENWVQTLAGRNRRANDLTSEDLKMSPRLYRPGAFLTSVSFLRRTLSM